MEFAAFHWTLSVLILASFFVDPSISLGIHPSLIETHISNRFHHIERDVHHISKRDDDQLNYNLLNKASVAGNSSLELIYNSTIKLVNLKDVHEQLTGKVFCMESYVSNLC